jgi:flagellar basal-body rod protein FlgG
MLDALGNAVGGLMAQTQRFDLAANELANVTTPAHKVVRSQLDSRNGGGIEERTQTLWQQGPVATTNANLDLAVVGDGFFRLRQADGRLAYTRNGSFGLDAKGRLAASGGQLLEPPITVPPGAEDVRVSPDGHVTAVVAGTVQDLGRIELATFPNPAGLSALGGGLEAPTPASGGERLARPGEARIEQGALEGSNTDVAGAVVTTIEAGAAYRALGGVVRAQDEALGSLFDAVA